MMMLLTEDRSDGENLVVKKALMMMVKMMIKMMKIIKMTKMMMLLAMIFLGMRRIRSILYGSDSLILKCHGSRS